MFHDTVPDGLHEPLQNPPSRPHARAANAEKGPDWAPDLPHRLAIRFTGSGSEYFRIWIVNLLLILVTLGIYLPWAKVRRLKYFHGNTLVGDAPLGFHGNPRKMLRGYLLVGLMFLLYSVAGNFSPIAGLVALAIVMVVSPALLRASLQFRLANTSWRGLRFRFLGSVREVYVLLWPGVVLFGFSMAMALWIRPGVEKVGGADIAWVIFPMLFLVYAALFWMFWRLKKYQHDHYALAALQTSFTARFRQFVGVVLRFLGMGLVMLAVAGGLAFAAALALAGTSDGLARAWRAVLVLWAPLMVMLVFLAAFKPYLTTRLQNVVWCHTGSDDLQFHSALRFRAMFWLTLKNWTLILLTLGLYWPFAAIAMARMRLHAVEVATREEPDALVGEMLQSTGEAAGDAAGDLFGLDIGL